MFKTMAAACALLLLAHSVNAQQPSSPRMPCGEYKAITDQLKKQYKEVPVAFGLQTNGNLIQVYAAAETWTIVSVFPDGKACIVAAGKDWEMLHHIPEGPMA